MSAPGMVVRKVLQDLNLWCAISAYILEKSDMNAMFAYRNSIKRIIYQGINKDIAVTRKCRLTSIFLSSINSKACESSLIIN